MENKHIEQSYPDDKAVGVEERYEYSSDNAGETREDVFVNEKALLRKM